MENAWDSTVSVLIVRYSQFIAVSREGTKIRYITIDEGMQPSYSLKHSSCLCSKSLSRQGSPRSADGWIPRRDYV